MSRHTNKNRLKAVSLSTKIYEPVNLYDQK